MLRLLPMLATRLIRDWSTAIERLKRNLVLYLIVALMFLGSLASAIVGGGIYLAQIIGPVEAAMAIAAAMFAIALAILGWMSLISSLERRVARKRSSSGAGGAVAASAAVSLLPILMRHKALVGLAVAGGATAWMIANKSDDAD